ncbi:hypothetical protein SSS_07967 [Sarcoptes scabiei]|uniref:Uncharacterized protein n=1 Tax=Sarcoptes scabiei TaxID=52283 RepID=A0A834VF63_SARSC|nr:hypothetical protein SSS_07967 [Sarcoptes scabiei]
MLLKTLRFKFLFLGSLCLILLHSFHFADCFANKIQRLIRTVAGTRIMINPSILIPEIRGNHLDSKISIKIPITYSLPATMTDFIPYGRSIKKFFNPFSIDRSASDNSSSSIDSLSLIELINTNTKLELFKSIEKFSPKFGSICLKRAVCEVAQTPIIAPRTGFLGEIIDQILTLPSKSTKDSQSASFDWHYWQYWKAQQIGLKNRQSSTEKALKFNVCQQKFHNCPFSIFKIIPLYTGMKFQNFPVPTLFAV